MDEINSVYELLSGHVFQLTEDFKKHAKLPASTKYDEIFVCLFFSLYIAMKCIHFPNAEKHGKGMIPVFISWVDDYLHHDEEQANMFFNFMKERWSTYTNAYNREPSHLHPIYWLSKEMLKNLRESKGWVYFIIDENTNFSWDSDFEVSIIKEEGETIHSLVKFYDP